MIVTSSSLRSICPSQPQDCVKSLQVMSSTMPWSWYRENLWRGSRCTSPSPRGSCCGYEGCWGPASAAGDRTCPGGLSAAAPLTSSSSSPLPPSSPSALRPPAPAQRKETLLSSSHRLRFVTGTLTVWLPVVKLCHSCCVSNTFSGLVFGSVHALWTMAAVL